MRRTIFALFTLISTSCLAGPPEAPSLLGIMIGKPIALPNCPVMKDGPTNHPDIAGSNEICAVRRVPGVLYLGGFFVDVFFPMDKAPSFMKGSEATAWLQNDSVQYFDFVTNGLAVQDSLYGQLVQKFGQPTDSNATTAANYFGAEFGVKHAQWAIGDIHIRFDGAAGGRMDMGEVQAETPSGEAMMLLKAQQELDEKQKL